MRYLQVVLIFSILGFCSCRHREGADEIAALEAELLAARAEAEAAKAELKALKDTGALAKSTLEGAAAEFSQNLPANSALRAQVDQARTAYEGTTPALPPEQAEEMQVLDFGKTFVGDLEQNRLTSAYRLTSAEYQKEVDREKFDALVDNVPGVKRLENITHRQAKVRKSTDGKEWEYYCTAREIDPNQFSTSVPGVGPRINFAVNIAKTDSGWQVTALEILREKTP